MWLTGLFVPQLRRLRKIKRDLEKNLPASPAEAEEPKRRPLSQLQIDRIEEKAKRNFIRFQYADPSLRMVIRKRIVETFFIATKTKVEASYQAIADAHYYHVNFKKSANVKG